MLLLVMLTWSDLQVASKLDPSDKETITKAVEETISWLDSNQLAEVCIPVCSMQLGTCPLLHHLLQPACPCSVS